MVTAGQCRQRWPRPPPLLSGAALPLLVVLLAPQPALIWAVAIDSLLFLALLGALAAVTGGSPVLRARHA